MNNILSQKEIDDLLNDVNLTEKINEEKVILQPKINQKIYKKVKSGRFTYHYEYKSPIIPNGFYIYNPTNNCSDNNKIIVRNIKNYKLFGIKNENK